MQTEHIAPRRGITFGDVLVALALVVFIAVMVALLGQFFGFWEPVVQQEGAPAQPTVQAIHPQQQPPAIQQPVAPPIQAQPVPVEHEVQYQAAPPAEVAPEQVQPRVEVIQVDRAPEQTTIIRTVPNKPAGAPIVIDKGEKRRGAP